MMDRRQKLIEIFEDTQRFYAQNAQLANAVHTAKAATKLYVADDYSGEPAAEGSECLITVKKPEGMRQLIIARKDLQMLPGKLAAQVSHASMAFIVDR